MGSLANIKKEVLKSHRNSFFKVSQAISAVYPSKKRLEVIANKIINELGQEVILNGPITTVSVDNPLSKQDIQSIALQGNNVIRLNLQQETWCDSASASVKGSYKQIVDETIHYAIQNGMAIILNLQQFAYGRQINMASSKSLKVWKEIASIYKNSETVIFELFGEPAGINHYEWLNGKFGYCVGYQELYDTVRNVGANNLVMVDGLNNSSDLSFLNKDFNVNGSNIVYCSCDRVFPKDIAGNFPHVFYDKKMNCISSAREHELVKKPVEYHPVSSYRPAAQRPFWHTPMPAKSQPISSQNKLSYREKTIHGLLVIQDKFKILPPAEPCKEIIGNSLALCLELEDKHASVGLLQDILITAQYEIQKIQTLCEALDDLIFNKGYRH